MRTLFLTHPGTNSRSIFQGLIRGFARAGHPTLVLDLAPFWGAYQQRPAERARLMTEASGVLRRLAAEHGAEASVAMWANGIGSFAGGVVDGQPRSVFDVIGLPHAAYWLDAPHWAAGGSVAELFGHPAVAGPALLHVVNNAGIAAEMTGVLGFGRTLPLAYGVDESVFTPGAGEGAGEAEFDLVVSCGPGDPAPTARELRELENDAPDTDALRRERGAGVAARLEAMGPALGAGGVELLRAMLELQLGARHEPMLRRIAAAARRDASLAGAAGRLLTTPRAWVESTGLMRSVESFERAFTIAWLSRRCEMAVFGEMNGAWPLRATRAGNVAFEAMAGWYRRGRAGLNVMRWQDDVGVNLKPLEIGASGVACVCGRRAGVGAMFEEGKEIVTFEGPRAALEAVRALRDSPARAREIGGAARARVEREHTWTHRAAVLAGVMGEMRTGVRAA